MSGVEEYLENIGHMDYVIVTKYSDNVLETILSVRQQKNFRKLHMIVSKKSKREYLTKLRYYKSLGFIDTITYEDVGLAHARRLGILRAETDWFVFIDDDALISNLFSNIMMDHLKKLNSNVESNRFVGAIVARGFRNRAHAALLKQNKDYQEITERMFTYATVILRNLVVDWIPPPDTNAYEDYLITKHIIAKGYRCVSVPTLFYHRHTGSDFKAGCWNGAGGRQTGRFKRHRDVLKYVVRLIGGGIKQTFKMNNDWFAIYAFKVGLGVLWGYFRWKKYLIKKT